ncbi:cytochrome-c peroxidase [Thauera mechernichensis]|uniref:Cytochrome-c peroxidase n=1 Tax=Thauera mechernichensis TaxID=82788 RepID=A0ABW3W7T6_9RHOO|nr:MULTISPECIES: cytochrome-c peroxidase [Thauera]ENO78511.1 cytochrome-c peroxidase [Thauera sp. 27]ENO92358.1 cytochrome-c peroxidase [Thauera sp. 28]MDG3063547.1 cytochrome-c peroxidase [Thauera mechernichensis]HNS91771.1 cytochrome-c peroxidase [Thauera sp.]
MFKLKTMSVAVAMMVAGSAWAATVRDEPIQPIQPAKVENPAKVELGKKLWFEPRLSMSGIISCNTCHNLSRGGTDNLKTSIGHGWKAGPVNSPTVLNSSLAIAQFWDGRAANLQEQAGGPIQADVEMNMPHTLALDVLQSIPGYVAEFKGVFGKEQIDMDMVTSAIAAFEETLVTPNSRFDKWLKGDDKALDAKELAGYTLFKESGCVACHNGPAAGGTSFQRMGLVEPYQSTSPAEGRSAVTGVDADRFNFKVPTLRNVEMTYPYFHDGEAATLEQAVDIMGRLQLGRTYSDDEIGKIVAFLKTMTGDQPQLTMPILPPSSNATPRPDPFK